MCFEIGFMPVSVPFTMVWMDFTFIQALTFDIAFTIVVPIYALIFNYAYDLHGLEILICNSADIEKITAPGIIRFFMIYA